MRLREVGLFSGGRRFVRGAGAVGLAVAIWSCPVPGAATAQPGCVPSRTYELHNYPGQKRPDIVAGRGDVLLGGFRRRVAEPALVTRLDGGRVAAKLYFLVRRQGPEVATVQGWMVGARDKRLSFLDPLTRRPTQRLLLRRTSILKNGTQRRGSRYLYQPNSVTADEAGCFVVVIDAGGPRRSLRIALPSGPRPGQ
jgi:hypothetical protein